MSQSLIDLFVPKAYAQDNASEPTDQEVIDNIYFNLTNLTEQEQAELNKYISDYS